LYKFPVILYLSPVQSFAKEADAMMPFNYYSNEYK